MSSRKGISEIAGKMVELTGSKYFLGYGTCGEESDYH